MTNPVPESEPRPVSERGRPHGKISSWLLVTAVITAFTAGGIALIVQSWWLFWLCAAVVVLSIPLGRAVRIMEDTMAWTHAVPPNYENNVTIEATRQQQRRAFGG